MVTLSLGMELLRDEHIQIDSLTGHGGLFKTPVVGQRLLAAALETPITVMQTAENGGPWGMAVLAAYMQDSGALALEDFLNARVFAAAERVTLAPDAADVEGFRRYRTRFAAALAVEKAAIEAV
jgi:sugar (pentulose or hexulose) kinase